MKAEDILIVLATLALVVIVALSIAGAIIVLRDLLIIGGWFMRLG